MIQKSFLICLFLLLSSSARSQGSSVSSSQLKLPLTARSAALGESTVADPSQFSSWFINPASLLTSEPLGVALTHSQWIQDVQIEYIGVRLPLSGGTLGMGVFANSVPGIEIRDIPGPAVGTFSARFSTFQVGYALDITNEFTLGASAKYIYEKLYVDEATGYGFDAGLIYSTPIDGLKAGLSLTNVGELSQFQNERSDLPDFSRLGISYAFRHDDFEFLASGAWAANLLEHDTHFQASLETTYSRSLSLRFGYQTGYESRSLSAGLGVHFEFIQLDYAYVPFSLGLGDSHFFSLGFQF